MVYRGITQQSHGNGQGIMKQKRPGQHPPRLPPRSPTVLGSVAACGRAGSADVKFVSVQRYLTVKCHRDTGPWVVPTHPSLERVAAASVRTAEAVALCRPQP